MKQNKPEVMPFYTTTPPSQQKAKSTKAGERTQINMREVLSEMVECSENEGMLPDPINNFCDYFEELFAMVKDYAENADCGSNREHGARSEGLIPASDCWHCRAVALVSKAEGKAQ